MIKREECPHGRRVDNCDTCDVIAAERTIAELTATIEQQHLLITMLERQEMELTAARYAEVAKAAFIDGSDKQWADNMTDEQMLEAAEEYASQILQQVKGGE